MRIIRYITFLIVVVSSIFVATSCQEEALQGSDYTVIGEDVIVSIPLVYPDMDVQSRANLTTNQTNRVRNVWIRTYSSITRKATSEWKVVETGTTAIEVPATVSISTKSGPSYIVAVANVDNQGVRKSDLTRSTLRELLENTDTWEEFLDIAVVSPSTYATVNSPYYSNDNGLPMAGAYTNLSVGGSHAVSPHRIDNWQTENFKPYTIPASGGGDKTVTMTNGAIHLRRLFSQVTFNIIPGADVTIDVNSYRVVNVPKYTWFFERSATDGMKANFGDNCKESDRGDYYFNTQPYVGTSIQSGTTTGSYTFNFWQGENKHTALSPSIPYVDREKQSQEKLLDADGKPIVQSQGIQSVENNGLFTSLTGDTWTPNNMASYVLINCDVSYKNQVQIPTGTGGTESADRSGSATYMIHLGYMNGPQSSTTSSAAGADFNCFRNTRYTYNVTVNGVNDIYVEAYHDGDTPGVEGIVSDVTNPTINLDCHYATFNIQLSADDLQPFDPTHNGDNKGFGFILTTYDNGVEKRFEETDFINANGDGIISWDDIADEKTKEYLNWVELRPTTDASTLAIYKPRKGSPYYSSSTSGIDDLTFNLLDAAHGISESQKSATGWYTVFVNEYTYEGNTGGEYGNETMSGTPIWWRYVNQDPRRFYIRVSKSVSDDGESIYARSKYAGVQESMMTYYSSDAIPEATAGSGEVAGTAIGVELKNESLGLNLQRSFTAATDNNNGRYNCWLYTRYSYNNRNQWQARGNNMNSPWRDYLVPASPQEVQAVNGNGLVQAAQTIANGNPVKLPKIYNYRGTYTAGAYYAQPSGGANNAIEAIGACMNRNRDNNGNGNIDAEEMRWYVPSMGNYLRIILGEQAFGGYKILEFPQSLPNTEANERNGLYYFFGSNGNILWGMEGFSTSAWGAYGATPPWQVRCIRSLGTDLTTVNQDNQVVQAYRHESIDGHDVVSTSYYDQVTSIRDVKYTSNSSSSSSQMPVHMFTNDTYNSLYSAFEIHDADRAAGYSNGVITGTWAEVRDKIESTITTNNPNPCTRLGNGWRVPNIEELAIMKNMGYLDETTDFFLSCSMAPYNNNKVLTTPTSDENVTHFFLSASASIITQGTKSSYQVRCVRDYPYTGD